MFIDLVHNKRSRVTSSRFTFDLFHRLGYALNPSGSVLEPFDRHGHGGTPASIPM